MAYIFRAPEQIPVGLTQSKKTLFLAGSIDMGKAKEWQTQMEVALKDEEVVICNPRRLDFDATQIYSEDNPYMVEQIEWELEHIEISDVVVFVFDENGLAPITLYELGLVSKEVYTCNKVGIVYCPHGYWKRANVIVNSMFYDFIIVHSMEELIEQTKKALK